MDRVLELNEPIRISLDHAEIHAPMSDGSDGEAHLVQQLSAGVWAYMHGDRLCLVTRSRTVLALLVQVQNAGTLQVESITETEQKDVTAAFRDGHKIVANWVAVSQNPAGAETGARLLWAKLSGQEPIPDASDIPNTIGSTQASPLPPLHNQAARPAEYPEPVGEYSPPGQSNAVEHAIVPPLSPHNAEREAGKPQTPELAVGPILPQSEIDRIIASLRADQAPPTPELTQPGPAPVDSGRDLSQASNPLSPGTQAEVEAASAWLGPAQPPDIIADKPATVEKSPTQESVISGLDFEQWSGASFTPTQAQPAAVESFNEGSATTLLDLVAGHSYAVAVFERRHEFERELEIARQGFTGSLIALWEKQPVFTQLTASMQGQLETYQAKYRTTAAALQKELTRLRQLEQIIPNLQTYQQQKETLAAEALRIAEDMRALRLRQILQNHEGRFLARRIFDIESRRRAVLKDMASGTYKLLRRSTPSLLSHSRFIRARTRFLTLQRQLEICFDKLAALERETLRRLEYRADWQALVKQQINVERELEETKRYIRSIAIHGPGGESADSEAIQRWLKAEWDAVRLRERLLHAWQEYLTEERSWIVRTEHDFLLVLGDASTLSLPGVARGTYLVLVADKHTGAISGAPDECEGWVMTDPSLRIIGSGRGLGYTGDPLASLANELANGLGLETGIALRTLGLIEAQGDMPKNQGGNLNV